MKHAVLSLLFGSLLFTGLVCEVQAKSNKKPHKPKPAAAAKAAPAPAAAPAM